MTSRPAVPVVETRLIARATPSQYTTSMSACISGCCGYASRAGIPIIEQPLNRWSSAHMKMMI
jgi:hypothetical protein